MFFSKSARLLIDCEGRQRMRTERSLKTDALPSDGRFRIIPICSFISVFHAVHGTIKWSGPFSEAASCFCLLALSPCQEQSG